MNAEIEQILINLEEYFENECDPDWDYEAERFIPNDGMKRLSDVVRLKELLSNESKKLKPLLLDAYATGVLSAQSNETNFFQSPQDYIKSLAL